MADEPVDLTSNAASIDQQEWSGIPSYQPVIGQTNCQFPPSMFLDVILNILKNPNITSSHLFRADILYDSDSTSDSDEAAYPGEGRQQSLGEGHAYSAEIPAGFRRTRTLIRQLVPRNPQLDKPLQQTCHFFEQIRQDGEVGERQQSTLMLQCIPHVSGAAEIPWYHPCVKGLLYVYSWTGKVSPTASNNMSPSADVPKGSGPGRLSVHYQLFSTEDLPLTKRLQRTAFHLLSTVHKHGQGRLQGYTKKFYHDLLIPQSRVQDTYAALKIRHAKRLCDNWVEVTEPSKHVFEDLSIAAFLIEFWRDMYKDPITVDKSFPPPPEGNSTLPEFPGFVDIGCGNGVLTEVLLCSGFDGWGFDARKRKTWSVLSTETKNRLEERILIPQPLLGMEAILLPEKASLPTAAIGSAGLVSYFQSAISSVFGSAAAAPVASADHRGFMSNQSRWHNGLFPRGTFIVSNHADELTAWTPLLASLSSSPFLAIPCCSHNLAGTRFRAPSIYTNFTADAAAPNYFAREKQQVGKKKHIAIHVPTSDEMDVMEEAPSGAAETGDLKQLSAANRAKQPSAYSSLCDWVAALADEVEFDVEKENLRIPSTRNMAVIGRRWRDGSPLIQYGSDEPNAQSRVISRDRWQKIMEILDREKPNSEAWIDRARKLMIGKDDCRVNHV